LAERHIGDVCRRLEALRRASP